METYKDFTSRIIETMGSLSEKLIGDMCNASRSTPGKWKKGALPRADNLIELCKFTDTSPSWLLLGVGPQKLSDCGGRRSPDNANMPSIDRVVIVTRILEEWIREQDNPNDRAVAVLEVVREAFPKIKEWEKKREQCGSCGTTPCNQSAVNCK